jgi:4-amino-4-deoxy-L-arabinose transferase-like glycosyltransferase
MTSTGRRLALILLVGAGHAAFYIWHQRPDWTVAWTDQGGYRMLADGLRASGTFTRYPDEQPFVPEALRTPGYPLFVAAVSSVAGSSHLAVAAAQGVLFVLICLMVFHLAGRVGPPSLALAAAGLTALYAPLPYFAALVLTELWTTFVLTAAVLVTFHAIERRSASWFAAAGFLYACTALSRPVFILLAPFLFGTAACTLWRGAWRQRALHWTSLLVVCGVTLLPWFAYNYAHFGRVTMSAAGGIGRGIWESGWQGRWPGRLQAELTDLASRPTAEAELVRDVERLASERGFEAAPMVAYVRQWREIRRIWTDVDDPQQRVRARVVADETYLAVGLANIRADPVAFLGRRVARGLFVLWAGEIPVRYTTVNALPPWVIRLIWLPQIALVVLGLAGLVVMARRGHRPALVLIGAPLAYVTAVHFILLTEARQSLPVKPLLIVAATAGGAAFIGAIRTHRQPRHRASIAPETAGA